MPYVDPEKERACARRRYERITAERTARGMCPRCGKAKPVPDRTLCRPCGEKRRKAERARHEKARAAGMLYAGRDAERCRRSASDRSKRRDGARREAGLCTRCGKQQPVEGGKVWTHPGKVEAPYTVCIASASNLTGLVKSSVECRRTGL